MLSTNAIIGENECKEDLLAMHHFVTIVVMIMKYINENVIEYPVISS